MPTKSCLNCGYRSLDTTKCPLIGYSYTENRNQVCPYHTFELTYCGVCQRILATPHYSLTKFADGNFHPICETCLSASGTCQSCTRGTTCSFESDPSPLPKAVQKSFVQGNQQIVTTVPNPDRIKETCAKNCSCFDAASYSCNRQNSTCRNYESRY